MSSLNAISPATPNTAIETRSDNSSPSSRGYPGDRSTASMWSPHISADRVRLFLTDIEVSRHCAIATRNQRLAAIGAFAGFVGEYSPVHIEWSGQIRSIPFKNW